MGWEWKWTEKSTVDELHSMQESHANKMRNFMGKKTFANHS